MIKVTSILTAVLMLVLGMNATVPTTPAVGEEEPQEIYELVGTVMETAPEHFLLQTTDGQIFQVNVHESTVFEGEEITQGALVHVLFNGQMTRGIPSMIVALRVGCYARTGAVVELTEEGFTLDTGDDIIQVNAEAAALEGIEPGQQVTVYFSGAMTMSLPAQIGAELIVPAEPEVPTAEETVE